MITITDSGSLSASAWHQWANRITQPSGGMIAAPLTNTDDLLVLIVPAGTTSAGFAVSEATPGVVAVKPGQWVQGTFLDATNNVFIAPNSGTQGYAMFDVQGYCPAGLDSVGSPSPITTQLVGSDGYNVQVYSDGSLAVRTYQSGATCTAPPSNFSTNDWNSSSTPALPLNVKAVQVNTAVGTAWTLEFDANGGTNFQVKGTGPAQVPISPAADLSRIASPANGSTNLVVGFALS